MTPILPPIARLASTLLTAAALLLGAGSAAADEAAIRKNLAERLPNFPKIDEISKTPIPGLFEVRIGTEILYADEKGNHLIQGSLIDTAARINLTEARIERLTAIDFAALPLKDAIVMKQGSGARKLAIFEDPNCGYCKRFERDLQSVKDVTIYVFLYPILGPDSNAKSRDIWCAKDPAKAWRAWMLNDVVPAKAIGQCDAAALERNVAFGQKHRITGTPALVFENGVRRPGALPPATVEKLLAEAAKKS
jgi:thiol:disulfide interchange protein DsbC